MSKARLDKLLANLGYGSRKEVQQLARAGLVTLDGAPVNDTSQILPLSADLPARLHVRGEPLDPLPGLVLLLHKPLGHTCSHKEEGPLVYDLLPPRWRERAPPLSTVGRLDKETSGLLLLTDDGPLLHRITSPKRGIPKRYRARLARPLAGSEAAALASGTLMLESETKPLLPVAMETHSPTLVTVTLEEGRYHQVRRMFAALGNHVLELHRESIGALTLPEDLPPGSFRPLGEDEIAMVFQGTD